MKSSEVEVGGIYQTKVGIRTVEVRIAREHPKGGWDATSVASGKPIRVKDVARLRPVKTAKIDATAATGDAAEPEPRPEPQPRSKVPAKAHQPGVPKAAQAPRPMTCLDAAAAVLKDAGQPMQCKAMVAAMAAAGLWSSTAPTPAATLYSAILREVAKRGEAARFRKTDRGHFTLNG